MQVHLAVLPSGTPELEPPASSLSGFCVGARFPRIAPATWANDAPLETVANCSAPMACRPNVDQACPLAGSGASRRVALPGKAGPRQMPDKPAPPWHRLVGSPGGNSLGAVYAATLFYAKKEVRRTMPVSPFYGGESNAAIDVVERWFAIPPQSEVQAEAPKPYSGPDVPWIYFRDAAGRDWIRDYRGKLAQHRFWLQEYTSAASYGHKYPLRVIIRFIFHFLLLRYRARSEQRTPEEPEQ